MSLVLTLSVLLICSAAGESSRSPDIAAEWTEAARTFDKLLWPQAQTALDLISNLTIEKRFALSTSCVSSLEHLARVLEASAPTKNNFLQGFVTDFGDFEECINIRSSKVASSEPLILGQYCLLTLNFPLPSLTDIATHKRVSVNLSNTDLEGTYFQLYSTDVRHFYLDGISFGFCVPSNCTPSEVKSAVTECELCNNAVLVA
ncbi:unnamed protein product [Sphagnum jensenii]|uniref:Nose resistant-to-fluoxetine protein N-terminal domain-containing protein n=1 Tax=Sphagnum jensenii TaxID=128206 RepID=A0ABP0VFE5_9BRYO